MTKKVEFVVNVNMHGIKSGKTVMLDVDKNGVPLSQIWRRRLKDAKVDGCITAKVETKSKTSTKKDN